MEAADLDFASLRVAASPPMTPPMNPLAALAPTPPMNPLAAQVPPPPPPPPPPGLSLPPGVWREPAATRTPEEYPVENVTQLSVGSVGHPRHCAGACRYVKRKGGCREGERCPHCHLCFWSRQAEKDGSDFLSVRPVAPVSVGTKGHPHSCGTPCKYARRKGGCRDGTDCRNCHACVWSRGETTAGAEQHSGWHSETTAAVEPHSSEKASVPTELFKEMDADEKPCAQPGFFGQSSTTLQELITAMLHENVGREGGAGEGA